MDTNFEVAFLSVIVNPSKNFRYTRTHVKATSRTSKAENILTEMRKGDREQHRPSCEPLLARLLASRVLLENPAFRGFQQISWCPPHFGQRSSTPRAFQEFALR